eukprot:CAMPEP_0206320926 /NCGR_PEP_ID=MMETSP0106_2-20121207/18598_1 /ASSEMBLY_ACC=CAM_ASM_000206 /TAXON_ID=81532 /ORGANISM="Acanthoeca-like sp., Strain 10tr" /LENGTH=64 /DNA_ID=CAMNT_0053752955 /DNA_START=93 /DNA_END=283 /DNA_ORIENTATION=+
MIAARLGEHTLYVWYCVNSTPSRTSRFTCGVCVLFPFMKPKSLYPKSSATTCTTIGLLSEGLAA